MASLAVTHRSEIKQKLLLYHAIVVSLSRGNSVTHTYIVI